LNGLPLVVTESETGGIEAGVVAVEAPAEPLLVVVVLVVLSVISVLGMYVVSSSANAQQHHV